MDGGQSYWYFEIAAVVPFKVCASRTIKRLVQFVLCACVSQCNLGGNRKCSGKYALEHVKLKFRLTKWENGFQGYLYGTDIIGPKYPLLDIPSPSMSVCFYKQIDSLNFIHKFNFQCFVLQHPPTVPIYLNLIQKRSMDWIWWLTLGEGSSEMWLPFVTSSRALKESLISWKVL